MRQSHQGRGPVLLGLRYAGGPEQHTGGPAAGCAECSSGGAAPGVPEQYAPGVWERVRPQ